MDPWRGRYGSIIKMKKKNKKQKRKKKIDENFLKIELVKNCEKKN